MPQANLKISIYNLIRKNTCPFSAVEKHVPKDGRIYDLGCGFGLFSVFMYAKSSNREIIAVDWIEERINFALVSSNKIKFVYADVFNMLLDSCKAVILIDILYLFDHTRQKELLLKCYHALENNGVLLIKEMDTGPLLKYLWCLIQESIVTKIFKRNLSTGMYFWNRSKFINFLEGIGFSVKPLKLDKGYLYPHILYVCEKK